jgi:hypothetical protein
MDDNFTMKTARLAGIIFVVLFLAPLLTASPGSTAELTGSIFTNLYGFKVNDTNHIRSYSGARATLVAWRGLHNTSLEFHTNFRYAADLSHSTGLGPRFFAYEAYARLVNLPARSELSLGRQFVYNSIRSDLLDGLQARYSVNKVFSLAAFGGVSALSSDPEHIQKFSESGLLGGSLAAQVDPSFRTSLNLLYRKVNGTSSQTRAGLDAAKDINQWSLFGKIILNAPQTRFSDLLARVSVRPKNWYFALEGSYREPSVSDNSLWSIIDFDYYRQVRVEARRVICKSLSVGGQLAYTAGSPNGTVQTRLSIASPWYSLGWSHMNGYGGDNDGFFGTVTARLTPRLDLYAGTNLASYKIDAATIDRSNSYGSSLGLFWHGVSGFSVRAEGQWFKNRDISSGTRFYLQGSKNFSLGKPARKVRG